MADILYLIVGMLEKFGQEPPLGRDRVTSHLNASRILLHHILDWEDASDANLFGVTAPMVF